MAFQPRCNFPRCASLCWPCGLYMFPLDRVVQAKAVARRAHLAMMALRLMLLLLIVPSYFLALTRGRWTTVPLWLVSTSVMLTQFLMSTEQSDSLVHTAQSPSWMYLGEMTKIMLIPIAVQSAVVLSGMRIRVGNKISKFPQNLVQALDAGER